MGLYFVATSISVDPTNDIQLVIKQTQTRCSCRLFFSTWANICSSNISLWNVYNAFLSASCPGNICEGYFSLPLLGKRGSPHWSCPCACVGTALFVHVLKENVIKSERERDPGLIDLWFIKSTLPYGSRHWRRIPNVYFLKGGQRSFLSEPLQQRGEKMLKSRDHGWTLWGGQTRLWRWLRFCCFSF